MDLEFSPNILETSSLLTPNITNDPIIFKSSYVNNEKSFVDTTNNNESLRKSEHDPQPNSSQFRLPTESPFQKIVESGVLTASKQLTTDDGMPVEIPSTAEVL